MLGGCRGEEETVSVVAEGEVEPRSRRGAHNGSVVWRCWTESGHDVEDPTLIEEREQHPSVIEELVEVADVHGNVESSFNGSRSEHQRPVGSRDEVERPTPNHAAHHNCRRLDIPQRLQAEDDATHGVDGWCRSRIRKGREGCCASGDNDARRVELPFSRRDGET